MMDKEDIPYPQCLGKYKGFIRDNADPENRGRVRVYCPQVMGPNDGREHWLDWAEPCFPWFGGISTGDFGPPLTREEQLEDYGAEYYGVWIEFQGGQPDFPIWVGTFTIAPLPTSDSAHSLGVDGGAGQVGGGIIGTELPTGSEDGPLNPPGPLPGREARIRTRTGVDIVIGCEGGGYIILGAAGVHIVGAAVTVNGAHIIASSVKGSV